jgi:hypothetical protein
MSYTSLIHCEDKELRRAIFKNAKRAGLNPAFYKYNDNAVEITGSAKRHDDFVALFENNTNLGVLLDSQHPKTKQNRFQTHFRRIFAEEIQQAIKPEIEPKEIKPEITSSNRVATWFSNYYNFPVNTGSKPVIAIISLGGGFQTSDLTTYWKTYCGLSTYPTVLSAAIGQATVPKYTGTGPDIENTLDLEIAGAVCPGAELIFIAAPNTDNGFYQAFSAAISGVVISGVTYHPSIVSCSWGAPEIDFGLSIVNTFNGLLNSAAAAGVTILVASGDNGSNDGYSTNHLPNADYPAASPGVIAVGGTTITANSETLWSWNPTHSWGCGSGCSTYTTAPTWQKGIVTLPTNTMPPVAYLKGKRALPDIALNADPLFGYTIYMGGKAYVNEIGGTSCAAPLMAGYLGLINLRYPVSAAASLYSVYNSTHRKSCYNDIVTGTNDNIPSSTNLWQATTGFDLCSGMGSIHGSNLFTALKALGLVPHVRTAEAAKDTVTKAIASKATPSSIIESIKVMDAPQTTHTSTSREVSKTEKTGSFSKPQKPQKISKAQKPQKVDNLADTQPVPDLPQVCFANEDIKPKKKGRKHKKYQQRPPGQTGCNCNNR